MINISGYTADNQKLRCIEKIWGVEYIITRTPNGCKIMELTPGFQVSMHWHAEKTETFILVEGRMFIETIDQFGKESIYFLNKKYDSITLYPNTPHTFYTPESQKENTIFIEASTEDKDEDSFRIYPSKKRS